MNTGLQDAFNLCNKLGMVLMGKAHESLLLSYHEERKPVGEFLLKYTDRLFQFMVRGSFWIRLFRTFVLPRMMRGGERQTRFFRIGSQVAIRYRTGCLCGELHSLALPGYKIGMRIPNSELINSHVQKTDIHRIVQGNFFSLLVFFQKDVAKNIARKMIVIGHELSEKYAIKFNAIFASDYDAEKIMADEEYSILVNSELLQTQEEPFFLVVRPDHHLFCYGYLGDLFHLDEELAQFLVRKKR
ncbi:MAG: Pentachlorophenol 4-monooxygenase [bacterium ADurb.BinA186]|nr:MAG: Pentachlorophenol 4-monooxygenase [bacterium ADurb.BinA186]